MIRESLLAAGLLLVAGVAMADTRGSFADSRGYNNCVRVAESKSGHLRVDSRYYIDQQTGTRIYYLNGSSEPRSNGVPHSGPGPVRIACETTASGHRVLGIDVSTGQYVARMAVPADLAAQ
jgi:hypothetical protein